MPGTAKAQAMTLTLHRSSAHGMQSTKIFDDELCTQSQEENLFNDIDLGLSCRISWSHRPSQFPALSMPSELLFLHVFYGRILVGRVN